MSQAKVDRYKDEKKNRKKNMKKEKVQNIIRRCAVCVIAVALIGCAGYSVHNIYESKKPTEKVTVDYSAMTTSLQWVQVVESGEKWNKVVEKWMLQDES